MLTSGASPRSEKALAALAVAVLAAIPILGDTYMVKVAIEVMVLALAAFSLNFLIGIGGLVSFGHAAYFGLGGLRRRAPRDQGRLADGACAHLGADRRGAFAALFGLFVVRCRASISPC